MPSEASSSMKSSAGSAGGGGAGGWQSKALFTAEGQRGQPLDEHGRAGVAVRLQACARPHAPRPRALQPNLSQPPRPPRSPHPPRKCMALESMSVTGDMSMMTKLQNG